LFQGVQSIEKLNWANQICKILNITLDEVAYLGYDINCKELLKSVEFYAFPSNAVKEIKELTKIINLTLPGGPGAVREFIDIILNYIERF
jgi:N-acylneuraminate cytidylyltransferase